MDKGGKQKERDLIKEAQQEGYQFVEDKDGLQKAKGKKLLGLFAGEGMAPELDRELTKEPGLAEMTEKAIDVLKQDKDGFFLMVEGSQIDWAGHAHDAAWAMKDTEAFEQAVNKAVQFAKKDKHTLVVIVGDHDTGGMSVGGYGQYDAKLEVLRNVTATGDFMATKINTDRSNIKEVVKQYTQMDLTEAEVVKIKGASKVANAINDVISERALVGWTSGAHTGTDLPLYVYGPNSELFRGLKNNTDLPILISQAMKLQLKN